MSYPLKPDRPRYKIKLHKKVLTEDSKRFDRKTKEKIKHKCMELLSYDPESVGEPLEGDLKNYRKLKVFNGSCVVCRVRREEVLVFVLAVGLRGDFEVYESAIKRLQD